MRESQYQKHLVKRIEDLFPGCIIQKNDPDYIQGDNSFFLSGRTV